jgi:hypothetical protein
MRQLEAKGDDLEKQVRYFPASASDTLSCQSSSSSLQGGRAGQKELGEDNVCCATAL